MGACLNIVPAYEGNPDFHEHYEDNFPLRTAAVNKEENIFSFSFSFAKMAYE